MSTAKQINDYILQTQIGTGASGDVYKAKHCKTKEIYALKVISKNKTDSCKLLQKHLKFEIAIMKDLKHPSLLRLHKSIETKNNYYLVLDYCESGDLSSFKRKRKIKAFTEREAIYILDQLIGAFKELQEKDIMHRDLKLDNIFVKGERVVIGDFGVSKIVKNMTTTFAGTPVNMAPEILKGEHYSSNADIWAIGVVFYELLVGKVPFYSSSTSSLQNLIEKHSGINLSFKNCDHFCECTKDFLRKILESDTKKRMSWEELFNHKIFTKQHFSNCNFLLKDFSNRLLMKSKPKSKNKTFSGNYFFKRSKLI